MAWSVEQTIHFSSYSSNVLFRATAMFVMFKDNLILICFQKWEVLTCIVEVCFLQEVGTIVQTRICPIERFWQTESYTIEAQKSKVYIRRQRGNAGWNIFLVEETSGRSQILEFRGLCFMIACQDRWICSLYQSLHRKVHILIEKEEGLLQAHYSQLPTWNIKIIYSRGSQNPCNGDPLK